MNAAVYHIRNPIAPMSPGGAVAYEVGERMTVSEWLGRSRINIDHYPTLCHVNEDTDGIMRAQYGETWIEDGDTVFFTVLPTGGDGGGSNVLLILALLVLIVITWGAATVLAGPAAGGAGAFGAFFGGAGALTTAGQILVAVGASVGLFLINRFLGPELETGGTDPDDLFTLGAAGNRARRGKPVPCLYGHDKFPPDYLEPPWGFFQGQQADPDSNNARNRAEHFIKEVFVVSQGECDVTGVFINDTNVDGFEEIEYGIRQPGEKLEIVPTALWPNQDIGGGIILSGPNELDGGGLPLIGQKFPADVTLSYKINPTNSVNDNLDGTATIELDAVHGSPWTTNEMAGMQIYITETEAGAAQTASLDFNPGSGADDWNHINNGSKCDLYAHPDKQREIVSNTGNQLIVRPDFNRTSIANPVAPGTIRKPQDPTARYFHIRQDYTQPFAVCPPGEKVNRFHFDITGTPIQRTGSDGKAHRFGVGIRAEFREVDDSDVAVSGDAGDWYGCYPTWRNWVGGINVDKGWIKGDVDNDGRRRSRHSNVAIWGAGGKTQPLALSFPVKRDPRLLAKLLPARYQVRFRRMTEFSDSSSISNTIQLSGVRGELIGADRTYDNWTVLEMSSKGTSQLNASSGRQVRVEAVRRLPQYGDAISGTLVNNPIQTFDGEARVRITRAAHRLALDQNVNVSGATATGGLTAGNLNLTGTPVTAIIDVDTFEYQAAATATSGSQGGGAGVAITATAGWQSAQPTSSPAWALADAARNTRYGGAKPDSELDIEAFMQMNETALARGDEFNGVFKDVRSLRKAFGEIARVTRSKVVKPNGVITPIRDEPRTLRSALFTGRNINEGSFTRVYSFSGSESPDGVTVVFKNAVTGLEDSVKRTAIAGTLGSNPLQTFNTEARVRCTRPAHRMKVGFNVELSGAATVGGIIAGNINGIRTVSAVIDANTFEFTAGAVASSSTTGGGTVVVLTGVPLRPAEKQLFGITNKEHAHREALYYAADHEHRRLAVQFTTELEGYLPVVGEMIGVSYPMPRWGQAGDMVAGYGPQKHTNPTFDQDNTWWGAVGSDTTLAHNENQNSDQVHTGHGSAKITAAGTAQTIFGIRDITAITSFGAGTPLVALIRVKGSGTAIGKTFQLEIEERQGGVFQAQSETVITLDGTWQGIETHHTILGGAIDDVHIIAVMANSQHQVGDVVYLDSAFTSESAPNFPRVIRADRQLEWQTGPELLLNPGFETDTSSWAASNGETTISRITTDALDRDVTQSGACMKIEGTTNPMTLGIFAHDTVSATVFAQNTAYTASCWVKAPTGNSAIGKNCFLILREEGGAQPTNDKQVFALLTDEWQRLEVRGKTIRETDRTNFRVIIGIGGSPAAAFGDIWYCDTVSLRRDDASVAHFVGLKSDDGSTAGALAATRIAGWPELIQLSGNMTFNPDTEGSTRERTQYTFGIADQWAHDVVVLEVTPRSFDSVEIVGEVESSLVHSADGATYVPPEDDSPQRDPDAPVVTNLTAYAIGPPQNRYITATWTAAPGASYYRVEIASGDDNCRTVALLAGVVNNGPFSDTVSIGSFSLPVKAASFPDAVFSSIQTAIKELQYNFAGHGMSVNDWFYCQDQLGSAFGVPVGELNGVHQVKAVVNADTVTFVTTTTPTGTGAGVNDKATTGFDLGAVGTVDEDQDTPTTTFRYAYVSGIEIEQYTTIAEVLPAGSGNTAGAYAITGSAAVPCADASWLGETPDTTISALLMTNGTNDTADKVVRVQAVGRLFGPWTYATAALLTPPQTAAVYDNTTGLVTDTGLAIGTVFKASVWVVDDTPTDVVTLPANSVVTKVRYWVQTVASSAANMEVGNATTPDTDAFAVAFPINTANFDDEVSDGVQIRHIRSAGDVVQVSVTTAPITCKVLVTVEYEIVPPVP